jgi:hypothetical protein
MVEIIEDTCHFVLWSQFCNMSSVGFPPHSSHASLELFHHLKQTTIVTKHIQKFEDSMALMQMEYPTLTEPYFISSFIARLKDGIKHYLVPHSPQTLSDTYWQAKELEKGILVKKSLMYAPSSYTRQYTPSPTPQQTKPTTPQLTNPPKPNNPLPPNKPIPLKPKEPGKCWRSNEPWTPEHKFNYKF